MPEKDFNLAYEVTHPPLYVVRPSDCESFYISRDADEQMGVVRWIVEYFYYDEPSDYDSDALLFDISGEPDFSDLDWLLRDLITDMYLGTDGDYDEWCEFNDSIEFIPWDQRHDKVA